MLILRDPKQLIDVVQSEIKALLQQRFREICVPELYDPDTHGYFLLVQPGDSPETIENETGVNLVGCLFGDCVNGDPEFAPYCECVIDHGNFFEVVYIFTDDGFARIFVIPKADGIDRRILALCSEFAEPIE